MAEEGQAINVAAARNLLLAVFTSETLYRFCEDRAAFRPLTTQFNRQSPVGDMVDAVLEYCRTKLFWPELFDYIAREYNRQFTRFEASLYSPADDVAAPSRPEPREVSVPTLLIYTGAEEPLVRHIVNRWESLGRPLLLYPDAFIVQQSHELQRLESRIRQCHSALVILSDTLLRQIDDNQARSGWLLGMLNSLTHHVIVVCTTRNALARAGQWDSITSIDASGWDPASAQPPLDLLSSVERAILACCPGKQVHLIGLPFVVVAMTRVEAEQLHEHLDALEQISSPEDLQPFQTAQPVLQSYQAIPSITRYGPTREQWQPFVDSDRTVHSVIEDVVDYLNDSAPWRLQGRRIKAQYYSFDPLVNKDAKLRSIYRDIAQAGAVVLIDEFSLFHPRLRNIYLQSPLAGSERVAVVTVSPFDPHRLPPHQALEHELRASLEDAFNRFVDDFDPQCEFGVEDEHGLKRWLNRSLPQTLLALREPPSNRDRLNRWIQEVGHEPSADYPGMLGP